MVALAFLLSVQIAARAPERSPEVVRLRTYVSPVDYLNPVYAEPGPGAAYLFYPNERVRFEVSVVNSGPVSVEIEVGTDPSTYISLHVGSGTADSQLIARDLWTVAEGIRVRSHDGPEFLAAMGSNVVLQPAGSLVLAVELSDTAKLPAGPVHIETDVSFRCEPACAVTPDANVFRMEVRTSLHQADRMERHYRRALRACLEGDLKAAEDALRAVDAEHNGTATALYLHGIMAEKSGDKTRALLLFRTARAVVASQPDAIDLKKLGRAAIDDFSRTLDGKIRHLEVSR